MSRSRIRDAANGPMLSAHLNPILDGNNAAFQGNTLARSLLAMTNSHPGSAPNQALQTLLGGLANVDVQPCVKGPFYEAMGAELQQVAQTRCDELVTIDFRGVMGISFGRARDLE